MSDSVKIKRGIPVLRDFLSGDGTPIVVDVLTGIAYYLFENNVYPIQGGSSVLGAFSSGFDAGYS